MFILSIAFYLSATLFLILISSKAYSLIKAPVHLRWELYPLPGERGKSHYGGSKLEEYEWWTKKHKKDSFAELRAMFSEIVLLKAVHHHNKKLWIGSFPFHFALYLYVAFFVFILLLQWLKPLISFDISVITYALKVIAVLGSILGSAGSVILLWKRTFNRNLALYSVPSHYFNIFVIGLLFISQFVWTFTSKNIVVDYSIAVNSMLTFSENVNISAIGALHLLFGIFLLAYIPFTHMTHFFTKYFTYHKVRWDDEVNSPGSKIEKKIAGYLNMPVSWAAPHISADGEKTWIAVAKGKKEEEKQ